jgi:hypothetical protein
LTKSNGEEAGSKKGEKVKIAIKQQAKPDIKRKGNVNRSKNTTKSDSKEK